MPTTIKVNGTTNGLVHKGTTHFAKNTPPDVCKTPSPGGPVPIPYPIIISLASDLAKGTTTVKAEGKMVAIKGSEFSRCNGDEPGTAGGVVSSTNMKEATWIIYSSDVKMDGKNACRFSDKMKMNHGNTVCMSGVMPDQVTVDEATKLMEKWANNCNKVPNQKGKTCRQKGVMKHQCMERKIQEHRAANPPDGNPPMEGERAYQRPTLNPDNTPIHPAAPTTELPGVTRSGVLSGAMAAAKAAGAVGKQVGKFIGKAFAGKCFPDAAILGPPPPPRAKKFIDFKFPCKKGNKTEMSARQKGSYDSLGYGSGNGASAVIRPTGW